MKIIANDVSKNRLRQLKEKFPMLGYDARPNIHAKMVLVDKNIVWISSQNFGTSGWFENTVRIKDEQVYKYFLDGLKEFLVSKR